MKLFTILLLLVSFAFADSGFLIGNDNGFDTERLLDKITKKQAYSDNVVRIVEEEAYEGGVDKVLALSIAKVESNFNPSAVSSSNAIGVMQLKMDTAVKDIYTTVYQRSDLPNSDTLFEPRQNAKLGVMYLALLQNKYFKDINDKQSREYCTIAAYNAGAGTVLRTFHQDKAEAVKIINTMTSDDVLRHLMRDMQSEQGKRYVVKVLDAKKSFEKELVSLERGE